MLVPKTLTGKLQRALSKYERYRFENIAEVTGVTLYETPERLQHEPAEQGKPIEKGASWGNEGITGWFRCDYVIPEEFDGKRLFVGAKTNGETLWFANDIVKGVFDVNHPYVHLVKSAKKGDKYHFAFEAYSGHWFPGCGIGESNPAITEGCKSFGGVYIAQEREDVRDFIFDFATILSFVKATRGDKNNFRAAKAMKVLEQVFSVINGDPDETPESEWRPKLKEACKIMKPFLSSKNSATAPTIGLVGHSHIDTAWLWPISETRRKCGRTFSSVLNLMEQNEDFIFIQSAPCHADFVRQDYPELFARIQERVKEGRWEPNGGMWVEPDCNITSGEAFVRQLLVGQNFTRKYYGYSSDTLWEPDVFGYSAALPQILKGCGIDYFCTTKLSWNDTNRFPYDTFVWEGIDGSSVLAHFNTIPANPTPETLLSMWNDVQHKDVQDRRLAALGHGDGGGGPTYELAEYAKRVRDLEGCPKGEMMTVSKFMHSIEDNCTDLPKWFGELYLELHRGTLTSVAGVKKGNRKMEFAMRSAEFIATLAFLKGKGYPTEELDKLWKHLLTHQFHDILPGSSIARVNDEALEAFAEGISATQVLTSEKALEIAEVSDDEITVFNDLSWNRSSFVLDNTDKAPVGLKSQSYTDLDGNTRIYVSSADVPALGAAVYAVEEQKNEGKSAFKVNAAMTKVVTPFAEVKFDKIGRIPSFIDKSTGRELVKDGGALNSIWLGEDLPDYWDNWDINPDQYLKMQLQTNLVSRELISNGALQLRIRSTWKIGEASTFIQDIVFYADSKKVDFETKVEWNEKHKLLKAGFDLNVFSGTARHEIQYGYAERPTHRNLSEDRARFEVCNHKWTDISEMEFGAAILNDCKYGISVHGSDVRPTLLKSGTHPDPRGDNGVHTFTYSLLPHDAFSVESVVRPAYELNTNVTTVGGRCDIEGSLIKFDSSNIIVEAVKKAEDGNSVIIRFYDALGTGKKVKATVGLEGVKEIAETNMLEEEKAVIANGAEFEMYVKPFEIKTISVKF